MARDTNVYNMCVVYCARRKSIILKKSIIKYLRDSINLLNETMTFNDQHLFSCNIYVIGDLAFFVVMLGKEHSSSHWCIWMFRCQRGTLLGFVAAGNFICPILHNQSNLGDNVFS